MSREELPPLDFDGKFERYEYFDPRAFWDKVAGVQPKGDRTPTPPPPKCSVIQLKPTAQHMGCLGSLLNMCVPANLQTGQNDMSEEWEEMDVGEKRLKTSPRNDGHKREAAAPVKDLTPDEYRAALEAENKSAVVVGWQGKLMRMLGLEK